jgi:hypothetical protein
MLFALACAAREVTVRFDALAIVAEVPVHSAPRYNNNIVRLYFYYYYCLSCLPSATFWMFP